MKTQLILSLLALSLCGPVGAEPGDKPGAADQQPADNGAEVRSPADNQNGTLYTGEALLERVSTDMDLRFEKQAGPDSARVKDSQSDMVAFVAGVEGRYR